VRIARRATQIACLVLFFWLLIATRAHEGAEPPPGLLQLFVHLDPLILVTGWLATGTVAALSLLALCTVLVTVVLGRIFCGWICPLGTIHHAFGWLAGRLRGTASVSGEWSRWQHAKYWILIALLVMSLLGAHWIGVLDPISLLYRSTTTAVLPAAQYAVEHGTGSILESDPHLGPLHLRWLTEPLFQASDNTVFVASREAFLGSGLILLLFLGTVLLNFVRNRLWCRFLCPLGALLGLISRRPVMRLVKDSSLCTDCGSCGHSCPAGAEPDRLGRWRPSECVVCWSCSAGCDSGAIHFGFASPLERPTEARLGLSRRAFVVASTAGVGGVLLLRLTPHAQGKVFEPALIRPPGARAEPDFLDRCIQCGMCMKVCPTNALHPASFEAGMNGLWSPVLKARIGPCAWDCNRCGQVCPTGAIQPLELEAKRSTKIGLAVVDRSRCLPWAFDRNCRVCYENCPVPGNAISFKEVEATLRDGSRATLHRPWVDSSLCTGCGICEHVCVFTDLPAIRVTSANEDRHLDNQPIMDLRHLGDHG
jgi:MauM/NapG family ferredoxin protein